MGKNKTADIEYPFEHGEVITLWMVYQYTQSLQRYRRPVTVTLKQLKSLMTETGEN